MPKVTVHGMDGLQTAFAQLAMADDETVYSILQAAADVYVPALRDKLQELLKPLGARTGQIQEAIKVFRRKEDGDPILLIYPAGPRSKPRKTDRTSTRQGKHSKPADNATVGFLLEYGTARMPALHWMHNTVEEKASEATAAAQAALEAWVSSLGL